MAIYHFTAKSISMGSGESAVHRAAYHARTQLDDERNDKQTRDYAHKGDLAWSGIFAPKDAPDWTRDRQQLWNRAEKAERQANGQPARNIEFALPNELTRVQQIRLLTDFAREQFARKGMVADVCLHSDFDDDGRRRPGVPSNEPRNDHVHMMLTMRRLDGDLFRKTKTDAREWNTREQLVSWRENWAKAGAKALRKAGFDLEADRFAVGHLTLPEQRADALKRGDSLWADHLDREPDMKQGAAVSQMEERGQKTDRGEKRRDLEERNAERADLVAEAKVIDLELERLKRADQGKPALSATFNDAAGPGRRRQHRQAQAEREAGNTIRDALDVRYRAMRASHDAAYQQRQEEIRQHRADSQAGRDAIYGRYATALDAIWKPVPGPKTASPDRSAWDKVHQTLAVREAGFRKREGTTFGQVMNALDLARGGRNRWADIFKLAFDAPERRRRFDRQQRITTAKLAPPRPVRDRAQPKPATPEPKKAQADRLKVRRTADLTLHGRDSAARGASMEARHQFQKEAEAAQRTLFRAEAKEAWAQHYRDHPKTAAAAAPETAITKAQIQPVDAVKDLGEDHAPERAKSTQEPDLGQGDDPAGWTREQRATRVAAQVEAINADDQAKAHDPSRDRGRGMRR